jgi:S-adenosylmethionine-diacylglycerol 3-amino-3-carboxypropyl transferase
VTPPLSPDNALIARSVQFAIVREDPAVEEAVLREDDREVLLVASGGCTALALAARHPALKLTLFDMNPQQLALVQDKASALVAPAQDARWRATWGIDDASAESLSGRGNFEALFRGLGAFLDELVIDRAARRQAFEDAAAGGPLPIADAVRGHRFWPVAFDLFFADPLLHTMFGPAATQHAAGPYARYFQRVVEEGMARDDAGTNPWLAHALLGCFLPSALPPMLLDPRPPADGQLAFIEGTLDAVQDLGRFDVVQLSNIFDWTPPADVARLCRRLGDEMAPGARLVLRQLNSTMALPGMLGERFFIDEARDATLLAADRSLFYDRLIIAGRR